MRTLQLKSWLATACVVLAGTACAAPPAQTVALADAHAAASESSRQTLKYLASCALGQGTVLTAQHQGVRYEFPGGIGLAPEWQSRGMTETEQRWVSACMLARTNFFGVPVQLSMRSEFESNAPGLQIQEEEDAPYTLEEGTFFGNLFSDRPTGYVCGPRHDAAMRAQLEVIKRICALPVNGSRSACNMQHVGICSDANYQQGGVQYRESIGVFLKPMPPRP